MKKEKKENIDETNNNAKISQEVIELSKEEVQAMNEKVKEAEDKLLRQQAEMINYRKRMEKESQNTLKYANEGLILELLPILDSFEQAISTKTNDLNEKDVKFIDGFNMIYTNLIMALEKYGIKEIESMDQPFDPAVHQAIMTSNDKDKKDGIITCVYQKGFTLFDKVLRPSRVIVNKNDEKENEKKEEM